MFPATNITLKLGYVNLIQAWNTSMPFSTIIYDRKFVDLLMGAVSGKRPTSVMNKRQKDFVQGMFLEIWLLHIPRLPINTIFLLSTASFILRVKNNAARLMRYSEYVIRYDEKMLQRQRKNKKKS